MTQARLPSLFPLPILSLPLLLCPTALRSDLQLLIDPLPIRHRLGAKEGGREVEETSECLSLNKECFVGVGRIGREVEVVLACEDEREGCDPAEEVGVVFLNAPSFTYYTYQRLSRHEGDSQRSRP